MPILAAIYNSQAEVEDAMNALYAKDVDSDDVILLTGDSTDSTSEPDNRPEAGMGIPAGGMNLSRPLVAAAGGDPTSAPNVGGSLSRLNLDDRDLVFYRQVAGEGRNSAVLFVEVAEDSVQEIGQILMDANAARVDKLK
ncbi:MAG: hypothetical protein ACOCX3_02960 [Chloroflexota bacterium]